MKWEAQHVQADLQQAGACEVAGALDNVVFEGVAIDTREDIDGHLYVALRGERFDAHAFVAEAVSRGARGLLVDAPLEDASLAQQVPVFTVPDTLLALQQLAAASLQRHPVIGIAITGSNGKTTTKDLTAQALRTLGTLHATRGNRNNHIGVPLTILERRGDERFLVVEMGANDFGEIGLLSRLLQPRVAVITNIGRAHLERLGDEDGVQRAKSEIFEGLRSDGIAVLNADDPRTPAIRAGLTHRRLSLFGFAPEADHRIIAAQDTPDGGQRLTIDGHTLTLARAGAGNARNAAVAFAVATALGADSATVAEALQHTEYTGQRTMWMQVGDLWVLDDTYNANPDSMRQALSLLQARSERHVAVLGEMLELGERAPEMHADIGRAAAAAGVAVLLGFGAHMQAAVHAAQEAGVDTARHFDDMAALLQFLQEQVRSGDAVLVKGSRGCRMERVVEALRAEVV